MRNIAIGRYRRNSSLKRIPSELTVSIDELYESVKSDDLIEKAYSAEALGQSISTFLHTLSEKERSIFMSRYYFYDSVREIAQYRQMTESAVYKVLAKLREKLRHHLESEGFHI